MGEWRSRVRVSVVEEGTDRPGSEIEAETTVDAPGPRTAIMAALRWVLAHAAEATPGEHGETVRTGPPLDELQHHREGNRIPPGPAGAAEVLDQLTPDQREVLRAMISDWVGEGFTTPPYSEAQYDIFEALYVESAIYDIKRPDG